MKNGIYTPNEFELRKKIRRIMVSCSSLCKPELCLLCNSTLDPVMLIHKHTHRNNAAGLWASLICWSRVQRSMSKLLLCLAFNENIALALSFFLFSQLYLSHNYAQSHPTLTQMTTSSLCFAFCEQSRAFCVAACGLYQEEISSDVLCTVLNLRVAQSLLINMSLRETGDGWVKLAIGGPQAARLFFSAYDTERDE